MLVGGGILILAGLFLLWLNRKFRLRRLCFLLYYEYACFAIVIVSIMTIFCANVLLGIVLTIVSLAISYLTIKWLTTSVRVRTYMGNDKYLRQGLFTAKLPSPVPADESTIGQAGMGQAYPQQTYPPQNRSTSVRSAMQSTSQQMTNPVRSQHRDNEWKMELPPQRTTSTQSQNPRTTLRTAANQQTAVARTRNQQDDEWELVEVPNEEDFWEEVPDQTLSSIQQRGYTLQQNSLGQQSGTIQARIPVRPDICCICGKPLYQGHAVIFTYQSGDEARIDEPCWNMVNDLANANNQVVMQGAVQYATARIPFVDPGVADYLQQRINFASSAS